MSSPEQKPIMLSLPESYFNSAVTNFEQDGVSFEQAITENPRMSYEVFADCLRDALFDQTDTIGTKIGGPELISKKNDGDEAFNHAANNLLDVAPKLGVDEKEVVITVIKNMSLWARIRKKPNPKTVVKEVRFTVPAA